MGWTPTHDRLYPDNLHLTLWQADEREVAGVSGGWGVNLQGTGEEIANQILTQLMSDVKTAAGQALRASVDQAIEDKKQEAREELENAVD